MLMILFERRREHSFRYCVLIISAYLISILLHVGIYNQPELLVDLLLSNLIIIFSITLFGIYLNQSSQSQNERLMYLEEEILRKNNLLNTLYHEMHTPLTISKVTVDLLIDSHPGDLNEVQQTFLKSINSNCDRLIFLVDYLLGIAKTEFGEIHLNFKKVDLRKIVQEVVQEFRPILEAKDQTIQLDFPRFISKVMADEIWMQHILINLLYNANKYTSEKGKIFVSLTENKQCILLSVTDDGSGIAPNDRDHIFDPFFRGSNHHTGAGLGLTIVKDIVEKHGGRLYVDTLLGQGTMLLVAFDKL